MSFHAPTAARHPRPVLALCFLVLLSGAAIPTAEASLFSSIWNNLFAGSGFVKDPAAAAKTALQASIAAQDAAVQTIVDALELWQQDRDAGIFHPMLLAFSGSTGVGKTSSAEALATAMLNNKNAFLELRGEDYEDPAAPIIALQDRFRNALIAHGKAHPTAAVILIDEAQKAISQVLDVLKPALSPDNPTISAVINGKDVTAQFKNVVFIIVSDIAIDRVEQLAAAADKQPDKVQKVLARLIIHDMNSHWKDFEVGGLIDTAAAFMPLTEDAVAKVIALRLTMLGDQHRGQKWASLTVDQALVPVLKSPKYITYRKFKMPHSDTTAKFAAYGARNVFISATGPIKSLQKRLNAALRPYNAQADVTVTHTQGDKVSIVSCVPAAATCTGDCQPQCVEKYSGSL